MSSTLLTINPFSCGWACTHIFLPKMDEDIKGKNVSACLEYARISLPYEKWGINLVKYKYSLYCNRVKGQINEKYSSSTFLCQIIDYKKSCSSKLNFFFSYKWTKYKNLFAYTFYWYFMYNNLSVFKFCICSWTSQNKLSQLLENSSTETITERWFILDTLFCLENVKVIIGSSARQNTYTTIVSIKLVGNK